MNTSTKNMKELDLNEMEQANGGIIFSVTALMIATAALVGTGSLYLAEKLSPTPVFFD